MAGEPTVGVLALQGDFEAHQRALHALGLSSRQVRTAPDLASLGGLVFPGGESTAMLRLLEASGLEAALGELLATPLPVLATCAGLILLAREVTSPPQRSLRVLDVAVVRNGYGRQVDSTVVGLEVTDPGELGGESLEGVFIRAPRVTAVGPGVRVLARRGPDPVLLRAGHLVAATFHPELSAASPVMALFAGLVRRLSR